MTAASGTAHRAKPTPWDGPKQPNIPPPPAAGSLPPHHRAAAQTHQERLPSTSRSRSPTATSETQAEQAHANRLVEALRYEPCSPTCANWLRYGVQPKNPRSGLRPGCCKGKAHRPEHLGYAGRRVLVSRKWSGKTLADHRADRKAWLLETLGLDQNETDPDRYTWQLVMPSDPDHLPPARRLLRVIAERVRWNAALNEARRRARDEGAAA